MEAIEAVARAACEADGLNPDTMIDNTDYQGGARSTEHHLIPQWKAYVADATKFVLMHRALAGVHGSVAPVDEPFMYDDTATNGSGKLR